MNKNDPVVIVGMARTPIGCFMGALQSVSATQLGASAIAGAVADAKVSPEAIDEVYMGCVLPAGLGQAPARQAALAAGLPQTTVATTVNKVCGSGLKSIVLAAQAIRSGDANVVVAGGMESMSGAPYLLPKARAGARLGHTNSMDHIFTDGLEDAYAGELMGVFAEHCVERYGFTREQQDAFALESLQRAQSAMAAGAFQREITPVTLSTRQGDIVFSEDETPGSVRADKIPSLRPAFSDNGSVTAANASSLADGAAAVVLMSASMAKALQVTPLAVLDGYTGVAQAPEWFTTAPVGAMSALLKKLSWSTSEVDLYEINEAFAAVTLAAMHDLQLPHERVNVHGGACALGHPLGATGARLVVTLLAAMQHRNVNRGVASLCIGGGEALALGLSRGS